MNHDKEGPCEHVECRAANETLAHFVRDAVDLPPLLAMAKTLVAMQTKILGVPEGDRAEFMRGIALGYARGIGVVAGRAFATIVDGVVAEDEARAGVIGELVSLFMHGFSEEVSKETGISMGVGVGMPDSGLPSAGELN